jgi:circadian clock protein KaiB
MPRKKAEDVTKSYEQYWRESDRTRFVLRLYVAGATPASTRAIANLRMLCEEKLKGRFDLEVIDIFQQPELAKGKEIIATPTLVKLLPLPLQRFIGDLEGLEGKLIGFDVRPLAEAPKG